MVVTIITIKSNPIGSLGIILPNRAAGKPATKQILNILLPIIFPIAKSCLPFLQL